MNSFMNLMNQAGEIFGRLAWPMFWQSCVLIAALLAADLMLRTKARASVRYGLWLVVLVKLCLPPTLALPTSPVWWLHGTPPPVVKRAVVHYAVTYSDELTPVVPRSTSLVPLPKIVLSGAAMGLMVSLAVSLFLLGWLAVRWWQIGRKVRQAEESGWLTTLCGETKLSLGMKTAVRARIAPGTMSPAVCGLFRPTILVPQALLDQFSEEQLRAVLLHELIHVRRRDVLVNFAQSLIQIVYWWHPLLWVANGRIRQVREEAVDDAVMLALREEAEAYAPTLLEVAKLALNRPLASLGLVGILESRQALRERIERLMDFRPPRRAGLTLASLFGIVAFMAMALPMGQRPVQAAEDSEIIADVVTPDQVANQAVVIQGEFYRVNLDGTAWNFDRAEYNAATHSMVGIMESNHMQELYAQIDSRGLKPFLGPRVQTFSGKPAEFFVGSETNGIELECVPVVKAGKIDLGYDAKFAGDVLGDGTVKLSGKIHEKQGHVQLSDGGGILISTVDTNDADGSRILAVFKVQLVTNLSYGHPVMRLQSIIRRKGDTNATEPYFTERLQKIAKRGETDTNAAQHLYAERLQEVAKRGAADTNDDSALRTRNYMIDVRTFEAALQAMQGSSNVIDFKNSVAGTAAVRDFLTDIGLDVKSPSGKAVFYNHRNGVLLVRSTPADLEAVDKAIQALNYTEPQIHINARFIEVPMDTMKGFVNFIGGASNATDGVVGILNPAAARSAIHELEARKGTLILAQPEMTMRSGMQAQVRATQVITLVTGCTNEVVVTNGKHTNSFTVQTRPHEFGSMLDQAARVLSDGRTISLDTRAAYSEFLGYAEPTKKVAPEWITNSFGEKLGLPVMLPAAHKSQVTTSLSVNDGQTVMLVLPPAQQMRFGLPNDDRESLVAKHIKDAEKKTGGEKEVIVFETVTLVDPAGMRIHADNQRSSLKEPAPGQGLFQN